MFKPLVASLIIGASTLGIAGTAGAPTFIGDAVERQRALGYDVCEPIITPLPQYLADDGVLADADNGMQSNRCEIRVWQSLSAEAFEWVAWHEVCHLSTIQPIYDAPDRDAWGEDWAHAHPRFRQCLRFGPAETGGYAV